VVDLDGGTTHRVGQTKPPDVLPASVIQDDWQGLVDVVGEGRGRAAD
jgi:hypothetical protein